MSIHNVNTQNTSLRGATRRGNPKIDYRMDCSRLGEASLRRSLVGRPSLAMTIKS
jgi:hypothetical protein